MAYNTTECQITVRQPERQPQCYTQLEGRHLNFVYTKNQLRGQDTFAFRPPIPVGKMQHNS